MASGRVLDGGPFLRWNNSGKAPRRQALHSCRIQVPLSGLYVGVHITSGKVWPKAARDTAFAVGAKTSSHSHPTSGQREECAATGMSQMAWQLGLERSAKTTSMTSDLLEQLQKYLLEGSWDKVREILRPDRIPYQMDGKAVSRIR